MQINFISLLLFLMSSSLCYGEITDQMGQADKDAPLVIEATEEVVCDETAQKCTATGHAMAQKGTNKIFGDILTAHFSEDRKITAITADGNVRMETPTDHAYGEHAHYDVALDRVIMTGRNLKVTTPNEYLTARDSLEYWHTDNKAIARGNAIATFPQKGELIQADTLVAYFKSSPGKAEGENKKQKLDRVEAEGNILASNPKGIVTGDRGHYLAEAKIVEVFNNVKLLQDDNIIEGGYVRYNLDTSIAEMFTQPPRSSTDRPTQRIHGIIMANDSSKLKENRDKIVPGKKSNDKDRQRFPRSATSNK